MLKMKGWKTIFYTNGNQYKAEVAILISDQIQFKTLTAKKKKKKSTRTLLSEKEINLTEGYDIL